MDYGKTKEIDKMGKMTKRSLEEAFAGESQAHMKYLIFSDVAKKEGKDNIARLFKGIAYAEKIHATNHARLLGYIGSTVENLEGAKGGEDFEIHDMYPAYHAIAHLEEDKGAQKSIHYALEAEKIHSKMYGDAKEVSADGKDIDLAELYVCPVCGFTHEGEPPECCPVCGVKSERFRKF